MSQHAAEPPANSPSPPRRWKPGAPPAAFGLLYDLAVEGARPLRPAAAQLVGLASPVLTLFGVGAASDALERLIPATSRSRQDDRLNR